MSWLFWKARGRQVRNAPDVTPEVVTEVSPTVGPTITYHCHTSGCPNNGAGITVEEAVSDDGKFLVPLAPPICMACGKTAAKTSTAGVGHL